jgi:hypothetical protein
VDEALAGERALGKAPHLDGEGVQGAERERTAARRPWAIVGHAKVSTMGTAAPREAEQRRRMSVEDWASLPEDEPGELVDGELG